MQCPRCQQQNPASQKRCGDCGMPLRRLDGSVHTESALYPGMQQSLNEALAREIAMAEILNVINWPPRRNKTRLPAIGIVTPFSFPAPDRPDEVRTLNWLAG